MSPKDWQALVERGVVDKVEMLDGVPYIGEHRLVFGPAQTAAARELGVEVYSAVDAVLEDPEARAEVIARLQADGELPRQSQTGLS